jgi:cell division protease FtsH
MDELDTLGKQRSLRLGGSNDEVEQTLNQLLASVDGLDTNNSGVILVGATNRYEILDPALTRPGRLDRIVRVELPDRSGREAILKVHARKVPMARDVDLDRISQVTPGLSGADLAGLVNEAAIRAVRRNSNDVSQGDFEAAVKDFFQSRGTDAEKNWRRLMASLGVAT